MVRGAERYLVGSAAAGLAIVLIIWGEVWMGSAILVSALLVSYNGLGRG